MACCAQRFGCHARYAVLACWRSMRRVSVFGTRRVAYGEDTARMPFGGGRGAWYFDLPERAWRKRANRARFSFLRAISCCSRLLFGITAGKPQMAKFPSFFSFPKTKKRVSQDGFGVTARTARGLALKPRARERSVLVGYAFASRLSARMRPVHTEARVAFADCTRGTSACSRANARSRRARLTPRVV